MENGLSEVELKGERVTLLPMRADHAASLAEAAADGALWNLWNTSVPDPSSVDKYIEDALAEKQKGTALPFVVFHNRAQKIIGTTRFCAIEAAHKRVEIGYTWYSESFQGTGVNTECKLLLLSHAFERLDAIAVEFRTHWHNQKSRAAIAKLGAKQDGVLRNHRLAADGSYRDTVVFSIIEHEWPAVKVALRHKLNR